MTIYRTLETDGVPAPSDVELEMLDRDHGMGFTIDIPCACGGTGLIRDDDGVRRFCDCGEGMELAMAEQVELMDAYAYQLGLCSVAERAGVKPPYDRAEQEAIRSQFEAALAQHDWIEERWQLLYDARDERDTRLSVRYAGTW